MSARTLLYDGLLYFLKNNAGILSAFDATSGRPHYQAQRIEGIPEVYSSPVAAQGRVYITGRDGTTVVLRCIELDRGQHGPFRVPLVGSTLGRPHTCER
jgi:outer membrane protein assembly factor BamB